MIEEKYEIIGAIVIILLFLGLFFIVLPGLENPYEIPKSDCENICFESNGDGWYSLKQIGNISNNSRYCNIKICEQSDGENHE